MDVRCHVGTSIASEQSVMSNALQEATVAASSADHVSLVLGFPLCRTWISKFYQFCKDIYVQLIFFFWISLFLECNSKLL